MQRFEKYEDLEKQHVTVEEREEYEQHLKAGTVVYAGVDYEAILREVTPHTCLDQMQSKPSSPACDWVSGRSCISG